ncbi:HEL312Cp [Eremothecium sinecaudum]|uniref:HEL312Cp n=1 Tax=Eremothecium sinecaudum TaxID=45286 RepID=A0A0X8HT34_9SACH|nr:HEL312Cp [Eremothecium sinecaudum]AMD20969.1 HEL312Cp [Eremothecium sinecaudum]
MVESISGFMHHLKSTSLKRINSSTTVRIACGNESADLDSVVSAITYAYFSYTGNSEDALIPVINIDSEDLRLRKDVVYVLQEAGIKEDDLFFTEDIQKLKSLGCRVEAILVDHNDPQGLANGMIDEVLGIVDHHSDLGLHGDEITKARGPRIIESAGSCSSLVFNYWSQLLPKSSFDTMKDAVRLSLGALLADTSNLRHKVEEHDLKASSLYKEYLPNLDFEDYYNTIEEYKKDLSGLMPTEVLKKDYKGFQFKKLDGEVIRVGTSSAVKPLEWLYDQGRFDDILAVWQSFIVHKNIDILALLTNFSVNGCRQRQLAFIINGERRRGVVESIVDSIKDATKLEEDSQLSDRKNGVFAFTQNNVDANRKQVVPLMQVAIEKIC